MNTKSIYICQLYKKYDSKLSIIFQTEDRTKAANAWEKIIGATKALAIHPNEALSLWSVLAAIYHLGVASVSKTKSGKIYSLQD